MNWLKRKWKCVLGGVFVLPITLIIGNCFYEIFIEHGVLLLISVGIVVLGTIGIYLIMSCIYD